MHSASCMMAYTPCKHTHHLLCLMSNVFDVKAHNLKTQRRAAENTRQQITHACKRTCQSAPCRRELLTNNRVNRWARPQARNCTPKPGTRKSQQNKLKESAEQLEAHLSPLRPTHCHCPLSPSSSYLINVEEHTVKE